MSIICKIYNETYNKSTIIVWQLERKILCTILIANNHAPFYLKKKIGKRLKSSKILSTCRYFYYRPWYIHFF